MNIPMKFFWSVIIIIALGAGAYWYAFSSNDGEGAHIIFKGPTVIFYGEPFEVSVGVSNGSAGLWNGVGLSLSLPAGFAFADSAGNPSYAARQLGDLGTGSLTETKFELVAVQADTAVPDIPSQDATASPVPASTDGIVAQLNYSPSGTGATFDKKQVWQAPEPQSALTMTVTAPANVSAGAEFKIKIKYVNVSQGDVGGLSLRVMYPDGFTFTKASTDPDTQGAMGGVWNIGSLMKGSSDSLDVFGRMKDATTTAFSVAMFRDVRGRKQPVERAEVQIVFDALPLTVQIDANDDVNYIARPGDTVTYTISYVLSGVSAPKSGVTVTASPVSPMFDLTTVVPMNNGTVRRNPQTGAPEVVWTVPGASEGASVGFTVKLKSAYDIRRLSDRDFILAVHAEVKVGSTVGSADGKWKVVGQTDVGVKAYFRDADSGIINKGSLPPIVGTATEYTVHWTLKNYATDIRDITVTAPLAPGVVCTGTVKSTLDAKPVCDAVKKTVTWNVPRMSATTGAIGRAPEAIFQISGTPTVDMVGTFMPLLGMTTLTATDAFTTSTISSQASEITTALPDDVSVGASGMVVR